jgi:nicotinamide riboside kinase
MSLPEYDSLVVNLFGGPGVGKSTSAAHIFSELKWQQISTELVPEYVKGKVHEGSMQTLEHQIYVFGKQLHYIKRAARNVDVVVQDASLLNSLIYEQERTSDTFKRLVLEEYNRFENVNIYIERDHPYDPEGRYQSKEEALEVDAEIRNTIERIGIDYLTFKSGPENIGPIIESIQDRI